MPGPLSIDAVRHVAALARLRLPAETLERAREELTVVLAHMETLSRLDLDGVEPMAQPHDAVARLAEDVEAPALPLEALTRNAPACEGRYLAVPKVLDGDGSSA